jgi:hypothetical protein
MQQVPGDKQEDSWEVTCSETQDNYPQATKCVNAD